MAETLPGNSPNQYFCFQHAAIVQIEAPGCI